VTTNASCASRSTGAGRNRLFILRSAVSRDGERRGASGSQLFLSVLRRRPAEAGKVNVRYQHEHEVRKHERKRHRGTGHVYREWECGGYTVDVAARASRNIQSDQSGADPTLHHATSTPSQQLQQRQRQPRQIRRHRLRRPPPHLQLHQRRHQRRLRAQDHIRFQRIEWHIVPGKQDTGTLR